MAIRRFHVSDLAAPLVHVTGDQARHALKVLRLRPGDEVVLFDGEGHEARGRIVSATGKDFEIEVIDRQSSGDTSEHHLILAVCAPKGERADWMIEKCAELGVRELIPLCCERSQVLPGEGKIDRWRRKVVEAAKQSQQAVTMRLHEPLPLNEVLNDHGGSAAIFFGDTLPGAPSLFVAFQTCDTDAARAPAMPRTTLVLVGPEGGFTVAERGLLEQCGGRSFRLADSVLRIETAAVAVASVWAAYRMI